MKRLVTILSIIFLILLTAKAENTKGISIEINKKGGRVIKQGEHKGEIGYKIVNTIEERKPSGAYIFKADCSGRGDITCPNRAIIAVPSNCPSSEQWDVIYTIVESNIDMGKITGKFKIEGFFCTWEEGKKEIDVEENKPVYSYRLIITDEIPVKMEIQLFPNPVFSHICRY